MKKLLITFLLFFVSIPISCITNTYAALDFTNATSDRVTCGSGSSVDDLALGANGFSVMAWVYRTGSGSDVGVVTKGTFASTGWIFILPGAGDIQVYIPRASVATSYASNTSALPANEWYFIAGTYDDSLAPEVDMYSGSLTSSASEVTYVWEVDGSGGETADAAQDLYVGNGSNFAKAFPGQIAFVHICNTRLTLAEIITQQFRPHVRSDTVFFMSLGYNGTGTQPDYSGNLNNGTVTGATQSRHVPTSPFFGID